MAEKTYVVQDADKRGESGTQPGTFPGTLQGLVDALTAARYRSAAGTPKTVTIVEGKRKQVIRRFEEGREVWSASRAEIYGERGS